MDLGIVCSTGHQWLVNIMKIELLITRMQFSIEMPLCKEGFNAFSVFDLLKRSSLPSALMISIFDALTLTKISERTKVSGVELKESKERANREIMAFIFLVKNPM